MEEEGKVRVGWEQKSVCCLRGRRVEYLNMAGAKAEQERLVTWQPSADIYHSTMV
jgi:hypothetical protein